MQHCVLMTGLQITVQLTESWFCEESNLIAVIERQRWFYFLSIKLTDKYENLDCENGSDGLVSVNGNRWSVNVSGDMPSNLQG